MLDDIAHRPNGERFPEKVRIVVDGEEDDLCLDAASAESSRHVQAIEDRHRNVQHHDIRIEPLDQVDRARTIAGRAHDLAFLRHHLQGVIKELRVVVGEDRARSKDGTLLRVPIRDRMVLLGHDYH